MKGDGKPVSFIEDCAVPLEHLAEYTRPSYRRVPSAWHGRNLVRPRQRGYPASSGRSWTSRRDGAAKMQAIAEEACRAGPRVQGRVLRRAWGRTVPGANRWRGSTAPRIHQAFREIKSLFDPDNRFNPDKIVQPPRMDDSRHFRYSPGIRLITLKPALDWTAWNVMRDLISGVETCARPGRRPRPGAGEGRGDVQQQRPLPEVRCRHRMPQLTACDEG
ncbi:FAD-linked oxidase C-terminal domain-containing protein [Cupriavidus basilensis]